MICALMMVPRIPMVLMPPARPFCLMVLYPACSKRTGEYAVTACDNHKSVTVRSGESRAAMPLTVIPVHDAMICSQMHNHARRPKFVPRGPPLPIKIFANWIGELGVLCLAVVTISRYSRSISSAEARFLRRRSNKSYASSFLPTEAKYRGLSGSILMKRARIRAGMHWKASKNRHRTSEYPWLIKERPKEIQ